MPDNLGDRMKRYEQVSHHCLTRRIPVIVRVDGKAFHSFTRGCLKPFDPTLIGTFITAATDTAREMQGFRLAYHQSDEVSFLLCDYDKIETEAWFDYDLAKIISISASTMTVYFNRSYVPPSDNIPPPAMFDARAFNVPEDDVANYFLWRAKDWERNSVSMYCAGFFSHKQMHGQGRADQHEMLHSVGKNWATDLSDRERNGTFLWREELGTIIRSDSIQPHYPDIAELVKKVLPNVRNSNDQPQPLPAQG